MKIHELTDMYGMDFEVYDYSGNYEFCLSGYLDDRFVMVSAILTEAQTDALIERLSIHLHERACAVSDVLVADQERGL